MNMLVAWLKSITPDDTEGSHVLLVATATVMRLPAHVRVSGAARFPETSARIPSAAKPLLNKPTFPAAFTDLRVP